MAGGGRTATGFTSTPRIRESPAVYLGVVFLRTFDKFKLFL